MSKADLEARVDDIFATAEARYCGPAPMGGDAATCDRCASMMLEGAWLELYELVDSLLDIQT